MSFFMKSDREDRLVSSAKVNIAYYTNSAKVKERGSECGVIPLL